MSRADYDRARRGEGWTLERSLSGGPLGQKGDGELNVFLGIDAGTTSLKAALFDEAGRLLAVNRQEYDLLTLQNSWIELDPEVYWDSCCSAVRGVIAASGVAAQDVRALAISSQGETLIPVDDQGRPTRRAIVWLDNRASEEARLIAAEFAVEEVYQITGQPEITPTWPACKLLWLRRNEPDVFARSAKFLLVEDYLLFRITGQFVTEYSLQTSSMLLDICQKHWWDVMLEYLEISPDQLGRLVEPGETIGHLSSTGAEAMGLSTGTLAISGALDQTIGAIGAGNCAPGIVTETTGGALAVVATLESPRFDPWRRLPCHYHALPDTYCLLAWGQTAGMALRWFRDQFCQTELAAAREGGVSSYDVMADMARRTPAGAEGLVMLPHLEGAACPEFNPKARAVFYGLALRHTRAHFVRAVMEAVAYMLRKNLDIVGDLGVDLTEIRSLGGGARGDLWLQIKADVIQRPVRRVLVEEAACLGAAMVCSVATGVYADIAEATVHMVRVGETFEPDASKQDVYEERYTEYLELYDRLKPMFDKRG